MTVGMLLRAHRGASRLTAPRCLASLSSAVPLSSERIPSLRRASHFSRVSGGDLDYFRSVCSGGVLTEVDDVAPYNEDWMHEYRGQCSVVLRPRTTQEVSSILSHCNKRRLAVVPQGGNTGLVGGSVPVFDEIVLSTSLMNKIEHFDPVSGILQLQAGVVLEAADQYLAERGFLFPLDLGAKGSCQVGGNVATNAGGVRLVRYGSLRGSVLGLEAVLPDGTILDNLTGLRKDNTGYDLKQLLIGSEGTLGVITRLNVLAPARSAAVNVALLGVSSWSGVLQVLSLARSSLGEVLSACEFFDGSSAQIQFKHGHADPFGGAAFPFYVLIETSGSIASHDAEKLSVFLERVSDGIVESGVVADSEKQITSFWALRESLATGMRNESGWIHKYDVSVPVADMYRLVEDMRTRLGDRVMAVVGYGHLGDGNLHLNILARKYDKEVSDMIEPFVFEWVEKVRGSISAEHGLGLMKAQHIHFSKSPLAVSLMQTIKKQLDPNGIMNPYKMLPSA